MIRPPQDLGRVARFDTAIIAAWYLCRRRYPQNSAMLATMSDESASSVSISRCNPAEHKLALALAANAWSEDERASRWQSLGKLIRTGQAANIVLVAAHRNNELIAAMLAEALPGRTAVTWLPHCADLQTADPVALVGPLYAMIRRELVAGGVHLAQALADPNDERAATLLKNAGFSHAADLLFLSVDANCFPDRPPSLPFRLEAFNVAEGERLHGLIDRT